jgi:hypothetical protein
MKLPNIFKVIKEKKYMYENYTLATIDKYKGEEGYDSSPIFESEKLYVQIKYQNYVFFMTLLMLYIISATHVVFMTTQSSSIVRFWNLIAYIFLLMALGHCLLIQFKLFNVMHYCDFFVCCVLGTTKIDFADLIMNEGTLTKYRRQQELLNRNFRCTFTPIIQTVIIFLLNIIVALMLVLYIIPYELETSQSDYSGDHIKYIASIICVITLYFLTIELFEYNWKSSDGLIYNIGYIRYRATHEDDKSDNNIDENTSSSSSAIKSYIRRITYLNDQNEENNVDSNKQEEQNSTDIFFENTSIQYRDDATIKTKED